jgi:hypothetical protein
MTGSTTGYPFSMDWHSDAMDIPLQLSTMESLRHMPVSRARLGIIDNGKILPQLLVRGKNHCCHTHTQQSSSEICATETKPPSGASCSGGCLVQTRQMLDSTIH